jgi:hypothetical protein
MPSPDLDGIAQDMALLELELAGAVERDRAARHRAERRAWRCEVTVVSYGAEREAHASIEEGCFVLESHGAVRHAVVQRGSGQLRRAGVAR